MPLSSAPSSSPPPAPPSAPTTADLNRLELQRVEMRDLRLLAAQAETTNATRQAFLERVPVLEDISHIADSYYEQVPAPHRVNYDLYFEGLRAQMATNAFKMIEKDLSATPPPTVDQLEQKWNATTRFVDTELNRIAGGDGKISVADFERAGVRTSAAAELLKTINGKDTRNPAEKTAVETATKTYLKQRVLEAATMLTREDRTPELTDRDPTFFRKKLQLEMGSVAMQLLGGDPPFVEAATFEKMLADLENDADIIATKGGRDALAAARGDSTDAHSLDALLETTTITDANGNEIEAPHARLALEKARKQYAEWNQNGDASGTIIGKKGDLLGIFCYYIGSTATGLGLLGDAIIHHRFGWENATMLGVQMAALAPEKVDNFLAGRDLNRPEPMLEKETLQERFSELSEDGQRWIRAIDPVYFGKQDVNYSPKAGSDRLQRYLRDARGFGSIETTGLVSFLSGTETLEDRDDLNELPNLLAPDVAKAFANYRDAASETKLNALRARGPLTMADLTRVVDESALPQAEKDRLTNPRDTTYLAQAKALREPEKLLAIHDIKTHITDPKEKRQMYTLLQACFDHEKSPTELYGSAR